MDRTTDRMRGVWKQLRGLVRKRAVERELDEEVAFHIAMETSRLQRDAGLTAAEARRRAHVAFGGVERYKEGVRDARWTRAVEVAAVELRLAVRSLARSPGLALACVATLAVGVGANTAVFSLVSATLLRPLPFADPERLVTPFQRVQENGREPRAVRWSYADFEALRSAVVAFEGAAAYSSDDANLVAGGAPVRVAVEFVTAAYFRVLGVAPALGRGFIDDEDGPPGAPAVAVVSDGVWRAELGGTTAALGATIVVNGVPLTVIGVMPPGFAGLTGGRDLWVPQAMAPLISYPEQLTTAQKFMSVVARLRPGVTHAEAAAEVAGPGAAAVASAAGRDGGVGDGSADPSAAASLTEHWTAGLVSLDEARLDRGVLRARYALAGAAAFVLLIAAVNVAGLLLARSIGRARERAVRVALGAGRGRLIRQALVESGVLGVAGGVVGVLLAGWLVQSLVVLAPAGAARTSMAQIDTFARPELDARVALFGLAVAVAAALLAGLVPALRAPAAAPADALRRGGRGGTSAVGSLRRPTLLSAVTVVQVACSLVLLLGAGLLLRAFHTLRTVEAGYTAERVVSFRVAPPAPRYGGPETTPLLERLLARVEAVPGVRSATLSRCTPFAPCSSTYVTLEGGAAPEPDVVGRDYVSADYFATLGVPVLRGRALTAADRAGAPRVAVINEAAAARFWPGVDPIGRRVHFTSGGGFASPDSLTEIVGVVGDVVHDAPGQPPLPHFYTSYLQFAWPATMLLARAAGDPAALVPALREAVARVDPALPIYDVALSSEWRAAALADERFATRAVAVFAALGLLLAALGVYGVMSYAVAQRRREIGIRMALGATPAAVRGEVVGHGVALAGAGLVVGAVVSLGVVAGADALVPGAGAVDPPVLAAVVVLLLLVAVATAWLPARRATRIDPAEVMAD
jgi:putative ABC transport system permease protein